MRSSSLFFYVFFFGALLFNSLLMSCSIYKSPDRKTFESTQSHFNAQNLKMTTCASTSVQKFATSSRLVTILTENSSVNSTINSTTESHFIWEHQIDNQIIFESNNLKGTYCLYENI